METNKYEKMRAKHQKEVNEFPFMFAFSDKQFKEGMEALGLKETDTDKIYSIGGGGYIRKTDDKKMKAMFDNHNKELWELIHSDKTGEGFIANMFKYELENHEYGYTGEIKETLEALGMSMEDIDKNKNLSNGLKLACNKINKIGKENIELVPKELEEKFEKYPFGSQEGLRGEAKVIVKYFNPAGAGTWLITEAEKQEDGNYLLFGYCHLGDNEMAEFGYVSLRKLEEIKLPFGLTIERDLYIKEDCTLLEAMEITSIKPPQYLLEEAKEMDYDDY
jgi:hypothetical protein